MFYTPEDAESMEKTNKITRSIMSLSPSTHFAELITGPSHAGVQVVTFNEGEPVKKPSEMRGLFDTGFTLGYRVEQNWVNLIVLIVIPVVMLLISYMAFMRQDITLTSWSS